jgi:hypothetical protein
LRVPLEGDPLDELSDTGDEFSGTVAPAVFESIDFLIPLKGESMKDFSPPKDEEVDRSRAIICLGDSISYNNWIKVPEIHFPIAHKDIKKCTNPKMDLKFSTNSGR